MRLLTYQTDDGFKLGAKTERGVLDVAAAAAAAGVPRSITPEAVYGRGAAVLERLRALVDSATDPALYLDEGDLDLWTSRAQPRQGPLRRLELSQARG